MRNLLCKVRDSGLALARLACRTALDTGWALWGEVTEGASRASWWVLVGLVWLDGLALGWWLWSN